MHRSSPWKGEQKITTREKYNTFEKKEAKDACWGSVKDAGILHFEKAG